MAASPFKNSLKEPILGDNHVWTCRRSRVTRTCNCDSISQPQAEWQNRFARNGYLTEIQAVAGADVTAGSSFSLFDFQDSTFNTYDFVRGAAVNLPDGNAIVDGQQLSFTDAAGAITTLTLTTGAPANANEVQFAPADLGTAIAANIVTALSAIAPGLAATATANQLLVPESSSFALSPQRFAATTVTLPADVTLLDGQALSLVDSIGQTTTITLTTAAETNLSQLNYDPLTASPADIAAAIATRLGQLNSKLPASAVGSDLVILGASAVTLGSEFTLTSFNPGATASQYLPPFGNVPIFYHEQMTSIEVRDAIRTALANGAGNINPTSGVSSATIENYPAYATNRIRTYNQNLFANTSAIGFSTFLPGDEFSANGSRFVANSQINTRPASNNGIEGVYIDDIVVGFAERGEVIYNATPNRNFDVLPEARTSTFQDSQQPEFPNEILVGGYSLEVRTASDYGVPEDYDPIRLGLNEQGSLGRSIDTNDRFAQGVTLIAPTSADLIDGDSFILSNGSQSLTFEFDSDGSVQPGNVSVSFPSVGIGAAYNAETLNSERVATSIRDAINSPQAFNVLGIFAGGRDGNDVGTVTGNRVELFGDAIEVNATSGRFIKVDLVAEETFYGRESARTLPGVNHANQTVFNQLFVNSFARATVTDYVNGMTDTLVAVGKIGDSVGTGKANDLIGTSPSNDFDIVKIFLNAGDVIDVDLDTIGWNLGIEFDNPRIQVYGDFVNTGGLLATSPISSSAPGEANAGAFVSDFTAPTSGHYYVAVSSNSSSYGEYQLTIRPGAAINRDVLMVDYHFDRGDENVFRDQGQLIIESNFISNFTDTGIRATFDPGADDIDDDVNFSSSPLDRRPGAVALLRNENSDRLLPGTVISNNVILASGGTGILYSGEIAAGGDSLVPVPFGRIVNNTIVGMGNGVGLSVTDAASPTVLNNIFANFDTGLNVDGTSPTIVGGNAYQGNGSDSTIALAPSSFVIPQGSPLFQDAANSVYIPASGSAVIDSSFASLNDRSIFVDTVKQPVGIASSPIIAPLFDAYGIPRFNDPNVTTPGGVGSNVSIDRGAIDRADFVRPIARLVAPLDFIQGAGGTIAGGDQDQSESFVRLTEGSVEFFEIQLFDPSGSGLDPRTITADTVILTEDGQRLVPDVDYTFGYSANSRTLRLTPLAGLWRPDAVYEITLNNQDRIAYETPAGDSILDGDQVVVTDLAGKQVTFEYDSGFSLAVPQTTLLSVLSPNAGFVDGENFTISAPSGNSVTFEINLLGGTTAGNVGIDLTSAFTLGQVRDKILSALSGNVPGMSGTSVTAFLDLAPVAIGQDKIQLGTLSGHSGPVAIAGMAVSGQSAGIADGDTFSYTTDTQIVTFEFDDDGSLNDAANVAIAFSRSDTPAVIAAAITGAVGNPSVGLGLAGASATESGIAVLGGNPGDSLDVTDSPLTQQGTPGVTAPLSLSLVTDLSTGITPQLLEGSTFAIVIDGVSTTFEYTSDPAQSSVNRLILLEAPDLSAQIVTKTAAALADQFPGVLTPVVIPGGVLLGEDPTKSTAIIPGALEIVAGGINGGAQPVSFLANSPATTTAATLASAIESAVNDSLLQVTTFAPGGGTILFSGVSSLQGGPSGSALVDLGTQTLAVADLAGNPVRETRANNETRFSIIMPEVIFDLGDALESSYKTLLSDNGPRHTINDTATPRLGKRIDSEDDGQPGNLDDNRLVVTLSTSDPSIFGIDSTDPNKDLVTITGLPVGGETLQITVGSAVRTFELVDINANPAIGNIPVIFSIDVGASSIENRARITQRLVETVQANLPQNGDGLEISQSVAVAMLIESIDDEDGLITGDYVDTDTGIHYNVFLRRNSDPGNFGLSDISGFLNPLDPAGTDIDINIIGSGLLQVWIDFNGNHVFDENESEQVVKNLPVTGQADGSSFVTINIPTPADAVDGDTWMRVRISESGDLGPGGVAVGGEVEDYPVEIISVALPQPDPNNPDPPYVTTEDTTIDTASDSSLPRLATHFINLDQATLKVGFLTATFILAEDATNGTVVIDANTGDFTYTPRDDFFGIDTFTYRVSAQESTSLKVPPESFATVTLTVTPTNDAPAGQPTAITALEDLPRFITADELLAGSIPDAQPSYTSGYPTTGDAVLDQLIPSYINEANQSSTLSIASVEGTGGSAITAANAASTAGSLTVSNTLGGLDLQVTSITTGDLVSLAFAGETQTFEIVAPGDDAKAGTIAVVIFPSDTAASVADRLADAIDDRFSGTNPSVTANATGDSIAVRVTAPTFTAVDNRDDLLANELISSSGITDGLNLSLDQTPVPTAAGSGPPSPAVGDTVTVAIDGTSFTFEFLAGGAVATAGNIGVPLLTFVPVASGSPEPAAIRQSAAISLSAAIDKAFADANIGAHAVIADEANPTSINLVADTVTAGKVHATSRGSIIPLFDSVGSLIEVRYLSGQDLNRNNPTSSSLTPLTDEFSYRVRDNRISIQLVDSTISFGTEVLSDPVTATIDVAPQNDAPLLLSDNVTGTEDTQVVITPQTLLGNDFLARATAPDEDFTSNSAGFVPNDGALSLVSVAMVDSSQGTVSLVGGNVVFTPAANLFGDILFTYAASDQGINENLSGVRSTASLTSFDGTVTVTLASVNDPPTANPRTLDVVESADPGTGPAFLFTAADLINGRAGEIGNKPGDFAASLGSPFNEDNQTLRVVRFETGDAAVDESDLPTGVGLETLTLRSDAGISLGTNPGGTFEFDFIDGVFSVGRFIPADDYNASFPDPTLPTESLIYVVGDDGTPNARSTDNPSAVPAVITFNVSATNDAPVFNISAPLVGGLPTISVLEEALGASFAGFATDISGGPITALDETVADDLVTFSFDPAKNAAVIASGLFTGLPTLSPSGTLTVFPAIDQIGSATLVVTATDSGASPNTRTTDQTFVVHVRPVNDAPRFKSDLGLPTSAEADADEKYSVARIDTDSDGQIDDATITYTLKEDNTQSLGVTDQDFFIPLHASSNVGYRRVGLLDVFNVGPDNEASGITEGGSQTLTFFQAGNDPSGGVPFRRTDRGGILTPVVDQNNKVIGLNYRPPTDFNVSFAGNDSFTYTVQDSNTTGGETFDLGANALRSDPQTSTNRVELVLNPVNDRPEFNAATLEIPVQEDSSLIQFESFATAISPGPANSAFDEVDTATGQLVEFTLVSLDFPQEDAENFFSVYPEINEQSGLLEFRPAADVFGDYRFEVTLNDFERNGTQNDNTTRGDLISSVPVTLTINVQPVNDPPLVNDNADPLAFEILEDGEFSILVEGDNTSPALLNVFFPGPSVGRTDEAAPGTTLPDGTVIPAPIGAGQSVQLGTPIPTSSAEGGSIVYDTSGATPKLIYRPRPNFVGTDSFIYTVIDNGQTVGIDGVLRDDPRISSNIVSIEVKPVNDAPLFSGAADVTSDEDAGLVTIEQWAANVQAGPTTAFDELNGVDEIAAQTLSFVFNQTTDNQELFVSGPTATIDSATGLATLSYVTASDANGQAVFTVTLEDSGPRNGNVDDKFVSDPVRTFTITVDAVNDAPTSHLLNAIITREEDSGPYTVLQVDPISPGPSDELDQTVSFDIEPLAPEFAELFSEQPTINAQGILRFTPAPNRNTDNTNGPVPIRVIATDSLGAVADPITFSIVINEVNDSPRAFSYSDSIDEDSVLTLSTADLLDSDNSDGNDNDPDLISNASETVQLVLPAFTTSASGARVNFDSATGVISYDPTTSATLQALGPNETLEDSFSYSLVDATGVTSNLASIRITVNGINDAPQLNVDTPTLNPDGPTIIRPLDNDSDIDGFIDPASIQITLQPAFGSIVLQPDGTMVYTSFGNSFDEDVFRYTVADNLGLRSGEQLISIAANASPVAADDARGTFLDESLFVDVTANDFDPDGTLNLAGITIVRTPLQGEAVPQDDGTVQYLPEAGFVGIDTFDYRIADNDGRLSNVATVTIQVVASRLQNPNRFSDVNADGFVTAIDALLIVNKLARANDETNSIPVLDDDQGPNYFDVSGDQKITALDALRVINELSRLNNSLSGEQVIAPQSLNSQAFDSQWSLADSAITADAITAIADEVKGKLVDVSHSAQAMDEAISVIATESSEDQQPEGFKAIDDVINGLF